jgi:flavin-dependent dehydrogenase
MPNQYDVIIVGARCAGAALATHLGRAGSGRVLLVDSAKLPSDQVLSTHYLQPPGVAALDELGLGDRLRASAPPTRRFAAAADDAMTISTLPGGVAGYCIRRFKLDSWLQEAATDAGAELRDRTKVVELVRKDDRVAGVVVETPSGRETILADLVVGADGPHSTIAKLTGAEEYLAFESTRGGYWFYFPENEAWRPDRPWDGLLAFQGDGLRYVFNADDNLLLMVAVPPLVEAETWGRDYRKKTLEYLRASPLTSPFLEGVEPVGKGAGSLKQHFFYRRPVGPGFALVGDAGNFKDFVTGHGMTDALLGAKHLAAAILDGREEAYQHYWRQRDAESLPLYLDARRLGEVGANDPLTRLIFEKLGASPELRHLPGLVANRNLSPFDMIKTSSLVSWVLGALLRGRFDVLLPFFRTGKRMGESQKEIAARQALHAEARRALDAAPEAPAKGSLRRAPASPSPAFG